jgi:hypothetical protein
MARVAEAAEAPEEAAAVEAPTPKRTTRPRTKAADAAEQPAAETGSAEEKPRRARATKKTEEPAPETPEAEES